MQLQRVSNIDVLMVFASPVKRIARFALQSCEIDFAPLEEIDIFLRKILPYDSDDPHGRKKTRSEGEIGCRSAENPFRGTKGSFNGIECHRAHHQNAHLTSPTQFRNSNFGLRIYQSGDVKHARLNLVSEIPKSAIRNSKYS